MANSNLPDITFAETDASEIETAVITAYEGIAGVTLFPGDPRRLFLQSIAALIAQQRSIIDYAGKMNLLSYAQGSFLDALGELVLGEDGGRLEAQSALATVRFTLSEAQPAVITIAPGTEVSASDRIFVTTGSLDIPSGAVTGEVTVAAKVPGASGNGFLPGQVDTLVEPVPFVQSVANITVTAGGADVEGDENLRERIRLAPGSFSVAGPRAAYVFWARTANQAIIDVSVISLYDEPGRVYVRPLLEGGQLPTTDVIDQVYAVLSADTVRPLSDEVVVLSPSATEYEIDFDYWVDVDDVAQAATIQAAVTVAVENYRLWQRTAIDRDINPDELVQRVKAAGAKRVVIRSPSFAVIGEDSVAQETSVTANYQGVENA